MAERLSISRAWDETKARVAADGRLLAIVALALMFLPQVIAGTVAPPPNLSEVAAPGWSWIVALLAGLIGIVGQMAIVRLSTLRGTQVGAAVSAALRRLLPAIAALILFVVALVIIVIPIAVVLMLAGVIALPQPGAAPATVGGGVLLIVLFVLLLSIRFILMIPVAALEPVGPLAIVKRSWKLTAGHYWRLLAFVLLISIGALFLLVAAQMVGGIVAKLLFGDIEPFSAGALLTALIATAIQAVFAVVVTVMVARIYVQLAGDPSADVSVPSSGT